MKCLEVIVLSDDIVLLLSIYAEDQISFRKFDLSIFLLAIFIKGQIEQSLKKLNLI